MIRGRHDFAEARVLLEKRRSAGEVGHVPHGMIPVHIKHAWSANVVGVRHNDVVVVVVGIDPRALAAIANRDHPKRECCV